MPPTVNGKPTSSNDSASGSKARVSKTIPSENGGCRVPDAVGLAVSPKKVTDLSGTRPV